MFGVLPDGVSEVDALREEIVGLQWSYANAKGESGYTGEECEFRVGELRPGTVIFVEDDSEGDIMFAHVDGVAYEEMWRVTNRYGDVFEVDEPSVDRLAPGASGRLPVVYPVLD